MTGNDGVCQRWKCEAVSKPVGGGVLNEKERIVSY